MGTVALLGGAICCRPGLLETITIFSAPKATTIAGAAFINWLDISGLVKKPLHKGSRGT